MRFYIYSDINLLWVTSFVNIFFDTIGFLFILMMVSIDIQKLFVFKFWKKFIYFNWRLITLKYSIGCVIYWHESTTSVHVCPILNPPQTSSPYYPSGSSQCTSPKHSIWCIKPGLAIRFTYDNIHVSMSLSQTIPLFPSPRVQKTVLCICVSCAVSHTELSLPSF